MTRARDEIISLADTPYYHCMARCVRRAFLFGEDSVSGRSFDHRKAWVEDKLAVLGEVFAIDVCAYAVMSNHYHVVLHIDEAQAESWSEKEVMARWMRLFSGNVLANRYCTGEQQTKAEIAKVFEFVEVWRDRLKDISWFMRILNESIARMANEEDDCKGRFWEGRFKSQALLDESAVLACMAYVDLNPIRAGVCELPEDSDHTSIQQRLQELAERGVGRPKKSKESRIEEGSIDDPKDVHRRKPTLMSFNKGAVLKENEKAIAFSLKDYSELLDWTGRALRDDKRGAIPGRAPPILQRLGLTSRQWLDYVPRVEKSFSHAIGHTEALQQLAENAGLAWVKGQSNLKHVPA